MSQAVLYFLMMTQRQNDFEGVRAYVQDATSLSSPSAQQLTFLMSLRARRHGHLKILHPRPTRESQRPGD